MQRKRLRWNTRFGRWISSIGVERLAERLTRQGHPVTPAAVYGWLAARTQPRFGHLVALIRLGQGRLTLQDINQHATRLERAPEPQGPRGGPEIAGQKRSAISLLPE